MKHHSLSNHVVGYIVLVALAVVLGLVIACILSPKFRKKALRPIYLTLGGIIALYLVLRGIAEFWVINYSNPASYSNSWGGPNLLGVFAVHSGPGFIILTALAIWTYKRAKGSKASNKSP
jgi:hypothetical protein